MVFISCFKDGSPSQPEENPGDGGSGDNKVAVFIEQDRGLLG